MPHVWDFQPPNNAHTNCMDSGIGPANAVAAQEQVRKRVYTNLVHVVPFSPSDASLSLGLVNAAVNVLSWKVVPGSSWQWIRSKSNVSPLLADPHISREVQANHILRLDASHIIGHATEVEGTSPGAFQAQ